MPGALFFVPEPFCFDMQAFLSFPFKASYKILPQKSVKRIYYYRWQYIIAYQHSLGVILRVYEGIMAEEKRHCFIGSLKGI